MFPSSLLLPPPPSPVRLDSDALSSIKFFRKQWRLYCLVTGLDKVSEERKLEELKRSIGGDAAALIDTFLDAATLNCDSILKALEQRFVPKQKNVVHER
jgi:hypothetical protein